jgi:hypothetical protein
MTERDRARTAAPAGRSMTCRGSAPVGSRRRLLPDGAAARRGRAATIGSMRRLPAPIDFTERLLLAAHEPAPLAGFDRQRIGRDGAAPMGQVPTIDRSPPSHQASASPARLGCRSAVAPDLRFGGLRSADLGAGDLTIGDAAHRALLLPAGATPTAGSFYGTRRDGGEACRPRSTGGARDPRTSYGCAAISVSRTNRSARCRARPDPAQPRIW